MLPSSTFQVHVMLQIHESTELLSPFAEGVEVVGDTYQRMTVNIMPRARSTACSDFGTLIGLHDQRNLEWLFKSVLSNNQSQCREYSIIEWFLTNLAE